MKFLDTPDKVSSSLEYQPQVFGANNLCILYLFLLGFNFAVIDCFCQAHQICCAVHLWQPLGSWKVDSVSLLFSCDNLRNNFFLRVELGKKAWEHAMGMSNFDVHLNIQCCVFFIHRTIPQHPNNRIWWRGNQLTAILWFLHICFYLLCLWLVGLFFHFFHHTTRDKALFSFFFPFHSSCDTN